MPQHQPENRAHSGGRDLGNDADPTQGRSQCHSQMPAARQSVADTLYLGQYLGRSS
jgi:hypothetical protein